MPVSVKSFRENVPQKDSSPSQQAIYTSLGIGPASRGTGGCAKLSGHVPICRPKRRRGCFRRRYPPVQSPGIEVADFLAVRSEHRGDDDGALVEPERALFDER